MTVITTAEYASQGSLYHYLSNENNNNLAFVEILNWALDIARGVHYLHYELPVKTLHRWSALLGINGIID